MKRLFDFACSFVGLMVLSPILLLMAVMVRVSLGSPVLFKQDRPGYQGQPFKFYKFRTMTNYTDEYGNLLPDKERLTRFGSFLRKTSLDEFPSLLNVLKGDMSLVGPRPLLMQYLSKYSDFEMRRHEVKPGITGWAQINGRNAITWEDRFNYDIWYVDNQSFWLDLKILFLTLFKVVKMEGISARGEATMPEFKGSDDK